MIVRKDQGIAYRAGSWPLDPRRPSVVFIHGSGLAKGLWEYQTDALAAHVNTLALDLPGHGASDAPAFECVEDYAARVMHLIDVLRVPQPIPCGLSLGGAIALQMLLDYPEALAGGILIGTGARLRVHHTISRPSRMTTTISPMVWRSAAPPPKPIPTGSDRSKRWRRPARPRSACRISTPVTDST